MIVACCCLLTAPLHSTGVTGEIVACFQIGVKVFLISQQRVIITGLVGMVLAVVQQQLLTQQHVIVEVFK